MRKHSCNCIFHNHGATMRLVAGFQRSGRKKGRSQTLGMFRVKLNWSALHPSKEVIVTVLVSVRCIFMWNTSVHPVLCQFLHACGSPLHHLLFLSLPSCFLSLCTLSNPFSHITIWSSLLTRLNPCPSFSSLPSSSSVFQECLEAFPLPNSRWALVSLVGY